jgi:hypothetical protein
MPAQAAGRPAKQNRANRKPCMAAIHECGDRHYKQHGVSAWRMLKAPVPQGINVGG